MFITSLCSKLISGLCFMCFISLFYFIYVYFIINFFFFSSRVNNLFILAMREGNIAIFCLAAKGCQPIHVCLTMTGVAPMIHHVMMCYLG